MLQSRIGPFQEQADKTGGVVLVVGEACGLAGLMSESTPPLHCFHACRSFRALWRQPGRGYLKQWGSFEG